jgi:hypothetical protein
VYLTAVDFLHPPSGAFFEFTYAKDHKEFSPRIEYVVPGMGHSVDADVETRIPKGNAGQHLMQHFLLKDGEPEWWIFSCNRDLKCDYELHLGSLSSRYEAAWAEADRL